MRCHCELLCQSDCFWAVSVCLVTSGPSGFWLVLVVGLDEGPVRIHNTFVCTCDNAVAVGVCFFGWSLNGLCTVINFACVWKDLAVCVSS